MPVNPQASQANDVGKADQDSPFALLMAASAPKDDEPVRAQDDREKPANDQASAQPAPVKQQTRTESKSEAKPKAKPEEKSKPDENKTADNDGQDKQEEVAVANDNSAPTLNPDSKPVAANPVPPPQPVVPLIVIANAATQSPPAETSAQENATPVAVATAASSQPVQDLAALTAAQAAANSTASQATPATATPSNEVQTVPQPQQAVAAQAPAAQAPTQQTPAEQASVPAVSGTTQETLDPQPAAPQPAVQTVAEQQTDAAQSVQTAPATAKETLVQIATLQNPSSAKPAESGEQTDSTVPVSTDLKTDAAKPVAHEFPAQHTDNKEAKADAPRPEIAKPDAVKPDTAQPAPLETAAPKAAPQVQAPPNTNIASVTTNTATQNLQTPATLPGIPQHVQVSAQTAQPNMPALAVEIAAKSQSGAKQFDIRLDPPELGRVEVRLSIDAAGKASAHLSADQPQTLDLLQKDASSLTRALREAGLNVSQDGLNFSLRQQNHDASAQQGQGQGQGRNASRGMNLIATNSIEATQNSASWRGDGRLDIRV